MKKRKAKTVKEICKSHAIIYGKNLLLKILSDSPNVVTNVFDMLSSMHVTQISFLTKSTNQCNNKNILSYGSRQRMLIKNCFLFFLYIWKNENMVLWNQPLLFLFSLKK